jgi:RND superfamily putative drug exporter
MPAGRMVAEQRSSHTGCMLAALASLCHRRRWTVIAVWVAAAVLISVVSGAVGGTFAGGGRLTGTDSDRAYEIVRHEFPSTSGDAATVVFHTDGDLPVSAAQPAIDTYLAGITSNRDVADASSPFGGADQISARGDTAYATIDFRPGATQDELVATAKTMQEAAAKLRSEGIQVEFLGGWFSDGSVPSSEAFGLLAAVIILLIAFGSVAAMGLPIVTAVIGIAIGLAGVTLWTNVVDTPDFTVQVASMVGIGVGIDYALFIVTRYREVLTRQADPHEAVVEAISTAGRAVAFAGCTVVISLLGMFLMRVPFLYGLALGTSSAVLVAVLAALTLLPALLAVLGRHLDRFSIHRRHRAARETVWHRWSRLVQRHPARFALGGLATLLLAGAPVLSMRLAHADEGNDPPGTTTRQAYDLLADGFGRGANGALVIAVATPDAGSRTVAAHLATMIEKVSGVAAVGSLTPNLSETAALLRVVPDGAPQDASTERLVRELRDHVLPATGLDAHVGGQTASDVDFAHLMSARLPVFIGAVLLLSFLLLMAVFRSVLVPLKAVIMNLLSIGAAYGVMVAVFQWGWFGTLFGVHGGSPIEPWAPMMLFAIVFGLSMDYEVFLLTSVKERFDTTGDNSTAVVEGLASTARVITAAAAIMVCVFGSFVVGDMRAIKLIGLGLSVAVLVDATIVRMVLVPATMELLGRRNWWMPRWLDRVVPHLAIEQPALTGARP